MAHAAFNGPTESLAQEAAGVQTLRELSALLRVLRRRHARRSRDRELTYRILAKRTGCSDRLPGGTSELAKLVHTSFRYLMAPAY